jgi:hypothetical protein
MNQPEPFYMVYGLGQQAPTVKHHGLHSAKAEAERLAAKHPGITFYVLATVGKARKVDVEFVKIDPDEIPF